MKLLIERGREKINSNGGLVIVGAIIKQLCIGLRANGVRVTAGDPRITNADVLSSFLGLLSMGRTNFEDIEIYRKDEMFRVALGIRDVPSEGILRQRLAAADGAFDPLIREVNAELLSDVRPTPITVESGVYVPVDVDVTPFDNSKSHKECVGRTYKGFDGYAPLMAYVGLEGYMAACELRPGAQHCQKGTPEFLEGLLAALGGAWGYRGTKFLFRLDSGNDSGENMARLKDKADFIIKRNLRKESTGEWLATAKAHGSPEVPRDGKTVWIGDTAKDVKGVGPVRIVFEVVERTSAFDKKLGGHAELLLPEVEVATFWTSLTDKPETVIGLYHQHGTSEQFHSELKTDMDVERLPSGKFVVNATFLQLAMVAYNIVRRVGVDLLEGADDLPVKLDVARRRIRTVIMDIIMAACKLVSHSGRLKLRMGESYAWFDPFRRLYLKYC
jgi:hypothetical protein